MDVEHAPLPMQHKVCREQPHEAAEADELDAPLVERMLEHALERCTILSVRPVIDHHGGHTGLAGKLEARCIGPVGDDERNLGRIVSRLRGLDQRSHVGAAAGDQDGDALPCHRVTRQAQGARQISPPACRVSLQ
jgi:hypothetical protein